MAAASIYAVFDKKAPVYMRRLIDDFGFDALGAAAVFGNAGAESRGLTAFQEIAPTVKGSRGGWGWFQWTGPRRREFEAWCKRKGFGLKDDEAQYSFLYRELKGPEKKAVTAVKRAAGLEAKVKAFEDAYERAGVKNYAARIRWAQRALDQFQKSPKGKSTTPSATAPAPSTTAAPVTPAERPGLWATLWRTLRGKDAAVEQKPAETSRPGLAANGDAALYAQQRMLSDKGYTEVGQPDGLMGEKTRSAITSFRDENGLPKGDHIDERFAAALIAATPRQVSKARAEATATDLREKGNTQVGTFDDIGWLAKLIFGGAVAGAAENTGILGTANDTLQSISETFQTIASILKTMIGVVQWCVTHWWVFAAGAAVYTAWKVAMGILNAVVMFRQGFMARADR